MRRFLVLAFWLLLPGIALAQQSAPFIIDQNRTDRAAPTVPGNEQLAQPQAVVDSPAAIKPFTLVGVTVEGTSLKPALLGNAVQGFIGKTIDAAALGQIANAVSTAYAGAGDIALYTVSIPGQDFSGGTVRVTVTEGFIEHVDLAGDTAGDLSLVSAYASKLTQEKPLRRSTLQRYLSLIRDIPGLTADAKLLQSQAPGAVRLLLTLARKDHQLNLSLDDAGVSLLARYQGVLTASLYGLLDEGEETKFSFGTSSIFSHYQYYAVSDSEPLNSEGTTAQLQLGYLHTDIGEQLIGAHLAGGARSFQLQLAHPLIRSFDENLVVSGDIDGLDSANALLGNLLANEKVRALRLSATYSVTEAASLLALNANVSQGLDLLGAQVATQGSGKPDFEKLVFGGRYNHVIGGEGIARLRLSGQLAGASLPVSELYALGGTDFGRAYATAAALGDSGIAASLELGWLPKGLPEPVAGAEIFAFGDDGATWYRARNLPVLGGVLPSQHAHLASGGAGLRLPAWKNTSLELAAADALSTNAPGTRAGVWRFLFGLNTAF